MHLKSSIVTVGALFSIGCATKVPNTEACLEMTRDRAICSKPFSDDIRVVPADKWRLERVGRISLSPQGYGQIIGFIEEQCTKFQNCVIEDVQEGVDAFSKRIGLKIIRQTPKVNSNEPQQYEVETIE